MSHTTTIGVRVPSELADRLREKARIEDRFVSAVVRRAIDAHLPIRDAQQFEEVRR